MSSWKPDQFRCEHNSLHHCVRAASPEASEADLLSTLACIFIAQAPTSHHSTSFGETHGSGEAIAVQDCACDTGLPIISFGVPQMLCDLSWSTFSYLELQAGMIHTWSSLMLPSKDTYVQEKGRWQRDTEVKEKRSCRKGRGHLLTPLSSLTFWYVL